MSDSIALIIAVESYQDPDLPPAAHAETDAAAVAESLHKLGVPRDNVVSLLGGAATRTAVESRLRKLAKSPPKAATFFVWFSGHAFGEDGAAYLALADAQADDLAETSLPLRALLDGLRAAGYSRLVLMLDPRHGVAGPMPEAELIAAFAEDDAGVCLASCSPPEVSQLSGSLKAGIWAHLLAEALAGRAPRALAKTVLTADSLQSHLEQDLPRALRATFREAPQQTPVLITGNDNLVIADLADVLEDASPVADPRLQPLKRGVLRNEQVTKVKALSGYRKFHRLPDRVNANSRKFVGDLAAEDVKTDVDKLYAAIREQMGYKRRDVEGTADAGSGYVRTPDFEYSILIDLVDDDHTSVLWRREVANIKNPDIVLTKPFQQVFGDLFDTLVFEFVRPFDLEAWVDRIEEEIPAGIKLRTASDCSTCEVTFAGFAGVIRLHRDRIEITGRKTANSHGLVEAFLHFQDRFAGRKDLVQLPLLEG